MSYTTQYWQGDYEIVLDWVIQWLYWQYYWSWLDKLTNLESELYQDSILSLIMWSYVTNSTHLKDILLYLNLPGNWNIVFLFQWVPWVLTLPVFILAHKLPTLKGFGLEREPYVINYFDQCSITFNSKNWEKFIVPLIQIHLWNSQL